MAPKPSQALNQRTGKLGSQPFRRPSPPDPDATYRPVPHDDETLPVWRLYFEPISNPGPGLGLDVNGEAVLGREGGAPDIVDLTPYNADELGVSRRHLMLRPTETKLYVLDMGSTNGTRRNGLDIGVNTPYGLANGDILSLGGLEFVVCIVQRPTGQTAALHDKADLSDALIQIAKAITAQLELEAVLDQVLEMAMALTAAGEAAIWLVDEQTGDLFLMAERGIEEDAQIRHMRLPVMDTMAGQVIETGQPLRVSRDANHDQIKVKTGYLVEAVTYVPLMLGGVTFGVLLAAHREKGRAFNARDEKLLLAIGDFAAIAVQNSRLYQATDTALAERVEELTALNHAMSHDLKNLLNAVLGYAGLLEIMEVNEEASGIINGIVSAVDSMTRLLNQLLFITTLNETTKIYETPCDLADIAARAMGDLEGAAIAKSIDLDFELIGQPYKIQGNASRLYSCVLNLVDNAIKYSPRQAQVYTTLTFGDDEITVQVRDTGPGIAEEDLPYIFDKFYRGQDTSNDGQPGFGLGLATVKATVEAHDGTVTARNAEGGGAEFTISLPPSLAWRD